MLLRQAEALRKGQTGVLAQEFLHKSRDIQRRFIVDFLRHIAHCNDLHLRVYRFDIPKHIGKFLINILILIQNKQIIGIDRRLDPVERFNQIRGPAGYSCLLQRHPRKAVIIIYGDIGCISNFSLRVELQQAVVGQVKHVLLFWPFTAKALNRRRFSAADTGIYQNVVSHQCFPDKQTLLWGKHDLRYIFFRHGMALLFSVISTGY